MKKSEQGSLFWRLISAVVMAKDMNIPLHAAYAGYFIMLSLFPTLMLVLMLLNYTGLQVDNLITLIGEFLPGALVGILAQLVNSTQGSTGALVGLSALTALWSASRGIYGLLRGMNAIYDVAEDRGYLYTRGISVVYTFLFLLVLLLTLVLHVFGSSLIDMLSRLDLKILGFLMNLIDLRFILLLVLQSLIFTFMFMALPNRRNHFRDSLPGGVLSSLGWLVFSDLFSIYVENYSDYASIYGSVYAIAISMLWLYFCLSILFYGAALNRYLTERQ